MFKIYLKKEYASENIKLSFIAKQTVNILKCSSDKNTFL